MKYISWDKFLVVCPGTGHFKKTDISTTKREKMKRILKKILGFVILFAVMFHFSCSLCSCKSDEREYDSKPHYYRKVEPGKSKLIECDVAVYGGTPAGVTAAIQAAHMGKKAILVSFNKHVGGMTSGRLTATDIGKKETVGGVALEFYTRIGKISQFSPSKAWASIDITPDKPVIINGGRPACVSEGELKLHNL